MWFEVIRWVSIALCWVAITIDVVAFVKTERIARRLRKALAETEDIYRKLKIVYDKKSENSENKEGEKSEEWESREVQ